MEDKKYLYLNSQTSVYYDEEKVYYGGNSRNKDNNISLSQFAYEKAYEYMAKEIQYYNSHFDNIAVLAAAGTSIDNGDEDNKGKTRENLWALCIDEINNIVNFLKTCGDNEQIEKICKDKDLEALLSLLVLYEKLIGQPLKDTAGKKLKEEIEIKITNSCRLKLSNKNLHHANFLRKLMARKPSFSRVQLYTTNYDKLFEQAAQRIGATIIDGFSFTLPRQFSGVHFDKDIVYRNRTRIKQEESFIPNVFQLFKLHGSIDWEKREAGTIIQNEDVKNPCIIYPASDKYETSYEQPYFEMMAHFQQTLRKENTLLIVVGFGFKDKHIQNIIKEAVNQNPNFHLMIVCYCGQDKTIGDFKLDDYIEKEETYLKVKYNNVSILYSDFRKFVEYYPKNDSYQDNNYDTITI